MCVTMEDSIPFVVQQQVMPSVGVEVRTDWLSPRSAPFGNGKEILLQGFNWESHKRCWYEYLIQQADVISELGVSMIWLPPCTDSVSPEGYLPRDLYSLNSKYGSVKQLKECVKKFQMKGIKVLADVVLNHRCAHYQDNTGVWNQFGGKLNWDSRAIVGDDSRFNGKGNPSSGDNFHAAPNIDHSQTFVREDICEWLNWLKQTVGFDGWRLDFVRGFSGKHVKQYIDRSQPYFVVGEFWDSLSYGDDGVLDENQDCHRQRIIDWIKATGGTSTAFDVTLKGILHQVFQQEGEYWRLSDKDNKPSGVLGWWPSRAVLFLENHDTGSTQAHWPFPQKGLIQGYVYILTHPGTPTIFYDHLLVPEIADVIQKLTSIRRRLGLHCRSKVQILKAENDIYAAKVDDKLIMHIGPGKFECCRDWVKLCGGAKWGVWELQI
eukprot:TRINITY_DN7826_c0_g2_i2.p1 TRINITY_DN7826_c0_g2~~TRINITY_DN7826_c0_g2_i2.p1  ORF type:complete len:434 (-),score=39.38 TRINITY_DN7826_c0_g2_i2:267-1568(-)